MLIALGRSIGVGESPDRSLHQDVTDRLRERQMLLLLDNFEQIAAAAPMTAQLLDDCPEIKLLVTSREPLHVRREHVYPVPPLGLPPEGRAHASAAQYEGFEAIALFVERARMVRPDFHLDDENAAAVADICRRLDGLPLAIELAAARLRLLSPEALRDRLGHRLELLRSSSRDLPERQQTLRATIEWSYQLLEPGEQRVFETLAVFVDADVSAVEAVIAGIDQTADLEVDVIEALASLVEKSLVRQVDPPLGEPRLRMLETISEYAMERLDAGPFGPAARRAHATHYADLASRLRGQLVGTERDQAMTTMATEVGNLRVAWRFWTVESDLGQLTRLADSLLILNEARGWYHDTVELTTDLLSVLQRTTSTPELVGKEIAVRLVLARALMATQGLTPEVAEAYEQVLTLFERGDHLRQQYWVLRGARERLHVAHRIRQEPGARLQDPRAGRAGGRSEHADRRPSDRRRDQRLRGRPGRRARAPRRRDRPVRLEPRPDVRLTRGQRPACREPDDVGLRPVAGRPARPGARPCE